MLRNCRVPLKPDGRRQALSSAEARTKEYFRIAFRPYGWPTIPMPGHPMDTFDGAVANYNRSLQVIRSWSPCS